MWITPNQSKALFRKDSPCEKLVIADDLLRRRGWGWARRWCWGWIFTSV